MTACGNAAFMNATRNNPSSHFSSVQLRGDTTRAPVTTLCDPNTPRVGATAHVLGELQALGRIQAVELALVIQPRKEVLTKPQQMNARKRAVEVWRTQGNLQQRQAHNHFRAALVVALLRHHALGTTTLPTVTTRNTLEARPRAAHLPQFGAQREPRDRRQQHSINARASVHNRVVNGRRRQHAIFEGLQALREEPHAYR